MSCKLHRVSSETQWVGAVCTFWYECPVVVLACESLHVCTACIWHCEHARFCVEVFLCAIYNFHSFIYVVVKRKNIYRVCFFQSVFMAHTSDTHTRYNIGNEFKVSLIILKAR